MKQLKDKKVQMKPNKKNMNKVIKKPATMKAKSGKKPQHHVVIEVDEVYLNRSKLTKLTPGTRPKRTQLWLWGM
eukprot:468323-Amphidinium_carterae.1